MRTLPEESKELTPEEFRALLEERTRYYFGMSLDEFTAALDEGRLDDEPAAMDLAILIGARSG